MLLTVFVSLVIVVALSGITYGVASLFRHANSAGDLTPVTNGAVPKTQPTVTNPPTPTLADPFAGSPAESFANGVAGIALPHAQRVQAFSAAQVRDAYRQTRRMLVAADLNMPTLLGGSPDAFARQLIPQQQTYFDSHLDKIGESTRDWVTSFAPGSTQLVGHVIKVHGGMYATTGHNGSFQTLRINADYLFVYPVERPAQPGTLMRIVARVDVDVEFAPYTDPGGPLQPWWVVVGGGASGGRCDVNDGFIHPQFSDGPPDRVRPSGAPINPYDLNNAPNGHGCQATTGT
ncbi:MAG TPA: hypothetical protein VGS19_14005 [Streptosporangiaceae bacterium]|nr:hypothetical protein [Streptosporangiaceae bacterium]